MKKLTILLIALLAGSLSYAQVITNVKRPAGTPATVPHEETPAAQAATPAVTTAPVAADNTPVQCPAGEIKIGEVTWAGSNVNTRRSFAALPDSLGMLYRFNSMVPYTATDPVSPEWATDSTATRADWQAAKDPCPIGWRLPSTAELSALVKAGSAWYNGYDIPGRFYGANAEKATRLDPKGCVFLPAAGVRTEQAGVLYNQQLYGYYWSGRQLNGNCTYLYLYGAQSALSSGSKNFAYSVRCVKK